MGSVELFWVRAQAALSLGSLTPCHATAKPGSEVMTGTLAPREDLKQRLFEVIDKDGDDFLNKGEMRELAKLVGFDGNDEEWAEELACICAYAEPEYLKLCEEVRATPQKGIPKAVVLGLLDDQNFAMKARLRFSSLAFLSGPARKPSELSSRTLVKSLPPANRAVRELQGSQVDGYQIQVCAFDHQAEKHGKMGKGSFEGRREPKAQGGKSSWRGQTYEGWYGGDSYRENDWHGESWVGAGADHSGYGDYGNSASSGYSAGRALYFIGAPFEMSAEKLTQMMGVLVARVLLNTPAVKKRGMLCIICMADD
eukprot:g4199.t1